ncbi:hypothetical protein DYH09_10905, partial [bacterium CPR1]|nr:hypothetical protein [bacterium CPR1]
GVIRPLIAGDESLPGVGLLAGILTGTASAADRFEPEMQGSLWTWLVAFFTKFWVVEIVGAQPPFPPLLTVSLMLGVVLIAGVGWWLIWRRYQGQERDWLGLLLLPSEPESRSGLSDAYGLKRSLHVHLGGKCWRHAPPAGCVHDAPTIKPNAEQKKVFARATSEIAALASRAREKATERDWDLAWKQLEKKKPASGGPVPGSP